jgi:hypothetical protein
MNCAALHVAAYEYMSDGWVSCSQDVTHDARHKDLNSIDKAIHKHVRDHLLTLIIEPGV